MAMDCSGDKACLCLPSFARTPGSWASSSYSLLPQSATEDTPPFWAFSTTQVPRTVERLLDLPAESAFPHALRTGTT